MCKKNQNIAATLFN